MYNDTNKWRCTKDYYDNIATGKSSKDFYREQDNLVSEIRREQEEVDRKTSGMGVNE